MLNHRTLERPSTGMQSHSTGWRDPIFLTGFAILFSLGGHNQLLSAHLAQTDPFPFTQIAYDVKNRPPHPPSPFAFHLEERLDRVRVRVVLWPLPILHRGERRGGEEGMERMCEE